MLFYCAFKRTDTSPRGISRANSGEYIKNRRKTCQPISPAVYGPISIKFVNEPVINAIKKVAIAVHLRPVLDYDLLKTDKKVNLNLEVATLSEALDQILQDMAIQYAVTESGLLVLTQDIPKNQAEGKKSSVP